MERGGVGGGESGVGKMLGWKQVVKFKTMADLQSDPILTRQEVGKKSQGCCR